MKYDEWLINSIQDNIVCIQKDTIYIQNIIWKKIIQSNSYYEVLFNLKDTKFILKAIISMRNVQTLIQWL